MYTCACAYVNIIYQRSVLDDNFFITPIYQLIDFYVFYYYMYDV